ncbi:MAG: pyruvate dehydrogenase complex dihydrolipoamide acetyltransferase [Bacteroidetes bacterium]|jgi:pyruvate dehydrogenase E2 component (dihydrolipoamide acetyltransferase)|nr:pyruvate dehydrogenase complex dihydrolipoamide acetyltransferase [Bacteroidota bacterium]
MAEIVRMPKLSDTMTEGVVAKWHKKVGDKVKSGDLLADIETDKATMEFESFQDGILLHIGVEQGKPVPVDSVLAILGKEGEDISGLLKGNTGGSTTTADAKTEKKAEETKTEAKPETKEVATAEVKIPAGVEIVRMPKLSDTMTEGVVAKWHKKVGDKVKSGELLADIETDKATMEFESFQEGVLLYVGVEAGKAAPVDGILAILGKGGEDVSAIVAADKNKGAAPVAAKTETKQEVKAETKTAETTETKQAVAHTANGDARMKISPLAKKLAAEKGISLNALQGSGDGGRIVKRDIESYTPSQQTAKSGAASTVALGKESFTDEPASQMRKTIARRLVESTTTTPVFYLTVDVDMDNAIAARTAINSLPDTKVSFNDLVIKACAVALRKHPKVNSSWKGDKIRTNHHIHVGVAIAVEDGLLVPGIRFADQLSLSQISSTVKDLSKRAKDKKLQPADWEGNTFTVSNLGMFGISEFTSIINIPESCILSVGVINQVPVVKNGQVVPGNVMKVTLACDHRTVDGATGAAFLQTLKQMLENPVTMLA